MNIEQLRHIAGDQADAFFAPLDAAMRRFQINTPARQAAFLAQIAHESARFTRLEEGLNYSAEGLAATWPKRFRGADGMPNQLARSLHRKPQQIANTVYANRMGNGAPESGDGWRYRGRGLVQITGRENYTKAGRAIGLDLIAAPDVAARPDVAAMVAGWYWQANGCNELADAGAFDAITRRINGGLIGHDDRCKLLTACTQALAA